MRRIDPGPQHNLSTQSRGTQSWVRDLPTPFWHEGDQAGLPPPDSWNMANSPRDQPIRQWKAIHYHLWKASGISIFGASQYMRKWSPRRRCLPYPSPYSFLARPSVGPQSPSICIHYASICDSTRSCRGLEPLKQLIVGDGMLESRASSECL